MSTSADDAPPDMKSGSPNVQEFSFPIIMDSLEIEQNSENQNLLPTEYINSVVPIIIEQHSDNLPPTV
ncbi:hypothetical protein L1987_29673 [Smallanthus sonchifolius]|uniref:Uncharacterized protein n=1 Tax=Smallanthus sonchifolius TaxID=185202 RepID=A0ACB9I242_9ASTR|nr:hypothetical protein L1987_29673 [Smallanthus sonchifolius]